MKLKLIFGLTFAAMLLMACSLTSRAGTSPTSPGPTQGGNNSSSGQQTTPGGNATPNPVPVNFTDGLASLNSYQMNFTIHSIGPDPAQSSSFVVLTQYSQDQDAQFSQITNNTIPAGGGEPSTSDTQIYQIGNDKCSGSEEDWSWTSLAPNETEMWNLLQGMFSLHPLIDDPVFVAAETVNGIPSNHFTFKISGLGASSGATVLANEGEYWLAVEGQYIVKYHLHVGTSTDPTSNILNEDVSIEMTGINQPVSIAFPQGCLDASQVTPTP
jgi:hypothetical protein